MKSMKVWGLEAELSWMIRSGRFPESLRRALDGSIRTEKPTDLSMAAHTEGLTAECEGFSSTTTCADKEYCYWTAGDDSVKEGCYLNQAIAENDWRVTDAIGLNVDNLCPTACDRGANPPECIPQQMWARNYYLGELEKMRMVKPPVAYTLGVKIDNFAAHMSEVTENCSKIDLSGFED